MILNKFRQTLVMTTACVFAFLAACGKLPNISPNKQNPDGENNKPKELALNFAKYVTVENHNIILDYNDTSQNEGFSLKFSNADKFTCKDVSIQLVGASGLLADKSTFFPSPIETETPQYSCKKDGSTIEIDSTPSINGNFLPWADIFNINLGNQIFHVLVRSQFSGNEQLLTRGSQNDMNLDSSFEGCGLKGTVLQRVYNCSKKVINYAVSISPANESSNSKITNPDGTSGYYTLFNNSENPDKFWFLVACPAGNVATPQQQCTWLTPIVTEDNPSFDKDNTKLFTYDLLNGYQKRLLWGGQLNKPFNFEEASRFSYKNAYVYTDAKSGDDNSPFLNPGNGGTLISGSMPDPNYSVCASDIAVSPENIQIRDLVKGNNIDWQLPSYPELILLTGGTAVGYQAGDHAHNPPIPDTDIPQCLSPSLRRPLCNLSTSDQKFSFGAINVPGFYMTDSTDTADQMLWSSSMIHLDPDPQQATGIMWAFNHLVGGMTGLSNTSKAHVRCVSKSWY